MTKLLVNSVLLGDAAFGWVFLTFRGFALHREGAVRKSAANCERDVHANLYFEQVCFPGVHADIGGGYLEKRVSVWP
ncbi:MULTISPECIES: DUF2235 domain-containing protein [unclassified Bradyrhizobium]|uniref:DUF2235 domain-containing protein n=1 Tax=unclassified Bradyrhizobium TaxID=2631580 RepID=UPI001CD2C1CF|nr:MULTISPECIES: DUF2235 domain-containing protein [unclassified Bradyrhizobium]MCA1471178.1 DUF2235 domain-containing protein [Bradyrhizobium sp. IC3195]MCA1500240.1 DUF2235 domain-containing protein [Bradyrhizobium sp. NBAIM14]